jgi:uncharacterized protein (DUF433 family)
MPSGRPARYMTWTDRITFDFAVMGGKPCIRGMRVTVRTVVGLVAAGRSEAEILAAYPYLEPADIRAALAYAAWRSEERDVRRRALDALFARHEHLTRALPPTQSVTKLFIGHPSVYRTLEMKSSSALLASTANGW